MSADLYFLDHEDPQRSQPLTLLELHRMVKDQRISGQTMIVSDLTGETAPLRKFIDPVTGDAANSADALSEETDFDAKSLQPLALALTLCLGLSYAFHLQQSGNPSTAFSRAVFGTPGLLDIVVAYSLYVVNYREALWKILLIVRVVLSGVSTVSVVLGVVTHAAFAGAVPDGASVGLLLVGAGLLYALGILLIVNDPYNQAGRSRLGVGMSWIGLISWVLLAAYQVLTHPVIAAAPVPAN